MVVPENTIKSNSITKKVDKYSTVNGQQ